ncbi:MAG: hypothetical protein QM639_14255 [Rhodocyclaceae bacterium]
MADSTLPTRLADSLGQWRDDRLPTGTLLALWRRDAATLCDTLPEPFRQVLDDLLMRIESSQLFNVDACSFSRAPLADALRTWLDKATARADGR